MATVVYENSRFRVEQDHEDGPCRIIDAVFEMHPSIALDTLVVEPNDQDARCANRNAIAIRAAGIANDRELSAKIRGGWYRNPGWVDDPAGGKTWRG